MEQQITNSNSSSMSSDITALAKAFLLAKREFIVTGLGGTNAHQKYKYAKIEDIYHSIEAGLSSNNIIIWHYARPDTEGREYLHTRLIHTLTGQFIEDCRIMESEKQGNQGKGAANTYMRKYALLSLCAISTEDDDGADEERYISKGYGQPISDTQIRSLQSAIKSCSNGKTLYDNILKFNKINDLSELKASSLEQVMIYITNNRE